MNGYITLRNRVLSILETKLPSYLHYHSLEHTLDVLKVVNQAISREGISGREAKLLRLGTLLHDIGFTVSTDAHEKHSAAIARQYMEELEFPEEDIVIVEGIIAATHIPQQPKNKLEEIICDADLDYLGRSDFWTKSNLLYEELKHLGKIRNKREWNAVQIAFLEKHFYHTEFGKYFREPVKQLRIQEIKSIMLQHSSK